MFDFQISKGMVKEMDFAYQRGNLVDAFLNGDVDHIISGSNCFCTMGAGLAQTIKSRLPEMYEADCQTIKGDITKLGSFSYHDYGYRFGFNAYIQYNYGRNGRQLNYEALEASLFAIDSFLKERCGSGQPQTIGLPMIGCGLAGGHWEVVVKIVRDVLQSHCVYIYQI